MWPLPESRAVTAALTQGQRDALHLLRSVVTWGVLEQPLYPHRDWVEAGKCGKQPLEDLEAWVRGGTFHRYGVKATERGPTIEDALERCRDYPHVLTFDGKLSWIRGMDWSVKFRQVGDPDSWGMTSPHMTPEDAAYAALSMIEEHERDLFERAAPWGAS